MNEIKLGDKVTAKVSRFRGTVTCVCDYLGRETQYCVTQNGLSPDGKVEEYWFAAGELITGKLSDDE